MTPKGEVGQASLGRIPSDSVVVPRELAERIDRVMASASLAYIARGEETWREFHAMLAAAPSAPAAERCGDGCTGCSWCLLASESRDAPTPQPVPAAKAESEWDMRDVIERARRMLEKQGAEAIVAELDDVLDVLDIEAAEACMATEFDAQPVPAALTEEERDELRLLAAQSPFLSVRHVVTRALAIADFHRDRVAMENDRG